MRRRLFVALLLAAAAGAAPTHAQAPADRISVEEFKKMLAARKPVVALDVRAEIDAKIKGAKHIPLGELEARLKEIPAGSEVVTYCA